MPETSALHFGPYRLAGPQGPLFRDHQKVKLKPKALEVLWLLARQAGEVVTKTALLDALWPQTVVGEDVLSFQIQALRRVLEDDAKQPRYIATLHRVGYSFVAPVTAASPPVASSQLSVVSQKKTQPPSSALITDNWSLATAFVGREAPMARLHQHYAKALRGERQVAFVTGEAGIGKTALVDTFLAQREASGQVQTPQLATGNWQLATVLIGHGQCVEHYGAGEAYLPLLEAFGRLCRQPEGEHIIEVLQHNAPTWLVQLSGVLSATEQAALQVQVAGTMRERMLREMVEALEVLSAVHPLIVVLEDLHWSDVSTIEMLSLLARRREPARLLVLGTYRPMELILANHPLKAMKQELVARGQGVEVALGNLHPADVRTYLTRRFPDTTDESVLSTFVYRRTEGHPLFMVQMADYLTQQDAQGVIASGTQRALEAVVPHGLHELIEVQLGRLMDAERQVLEVASVAGAEFTTASVAAGIPTLIETVEEHCEGLARHGQFIEDRGLATWPDGTVSGRYGFRHALYQEVLYRRLSARQRARVHLGIGLREEVGYGERSTEIAAELAVHFERGRDYLRAIHYHQQAGEKALQHSANTEAIAHFTKGLELLKPLPDTPQRAQQEL
ncbi:MAG: AAA family ATPase, partial [Candidatus Binatia bacterium]